jgi:hypothetical protein
MILKSIIVFMLLVAGYAKTVNIKISSVDINQALSLSKDRVKKIRFDKLKDDMGEADEHRSKIDDIQIKLKELDRLNADLMASQKELDELSPEVKKFAKVYDRAMNKIYRKNSFISRDFYVVVVHKIGQDYSSDFDNYIIQKYSIKKYDQQTILTKSTTKGSSLTQEIKTQKDFGLKKVEIVEDIPLRDKGINIKIIKVTQKPLKKGATSTTQQNKGATTSVQMSFEESGVYVSQIESFDKVNDTIVSKFSLDRDRVSSLIADVRTKVDLGMSKVNFDKASRDLNRVLGFLAKKHSKLTKKFNKKKATYDNLLSDIGDIQKQINSLSIGVESMMKPYKIEYPKENNVEFKIITPKLYSEKVALGEEREFILRKIKSYLSKIDVSEVSQSETLKDMYDLSASTKNVSKTLSFQTLNLYPYIEANGNISVLIFASVKIKEDVSDDDIIEIPLKYATIRFVPFKKGHEDLFVSQDEISIGVVKEFLESSKNRRFFKKNFDTFCIEDSVLPEQAWDFKSVGEEYYDYPAVCYNIDKIPAFIKWLSKVTDKELVIPTYEEWVYVATNSESSEYPWGDKSVDELVEDDEQPENIHYPDGDDTAITKIRSFSKSLSNLYDIGGNVFEFVMYEDEYYYKGNSYSSFIEETAGEPSEYESDINNTIGLRLIYKGE